MLVRTSRDTRSGVAKTTALHHLPDGLVSRANIDALLLVAPIITT